MSTDNFAEKSHHQVLLDTETVERLNQAFVRQFSSDMENGALSGHCLAYALDAALAFHGLTTLNEEDYRLFEIASATVGSTSRLLATYLDEDNIREALSSHGIKASVIFLDVPNNESGRSILKAKMEAVDEKPERYILLMAVESDHGVAYLKKVDEERVIIANSHLMANNPDLGDARGVGIMNREELIDRVAQADRGVYLITLSSP